MKEFVIYGIWDAGCNHWVYIGQTSNFAQRKKNYEETLIRFCEWFRVEILDLCSTQQDSWALEAEYIHAFRELGHPLKNRLFPELRGPRKQLALSTLHPELFGYEGDLPESYPRLGPSGEQYLSMFYGFPYVSKTTLGRMRKNHPVALQFKANMLKRAAKMRRSEMVPLSVGELDFVES